MTRSWLLLVMLGTWPAAAQTRPPATCFPQCAATSTNVAANTVEVQACLIRCRAGAEFAAANRRAPRTVQAGRGVPVGPQPALPVALPPPPASNARWGAIYAAAPPGNGLGVSHGMTDRTMVHTRAEHACRAFGQPGCRVLTEFSAGCGAAAQALRATGIAITGHASTYRVAYVTAATGAIRSEAESRALAQCRAREPVAECRIAATACVGV